MLILTIWLKQQFVLIVIILYTSSVYVMTIVQLILITEIFKPQLFASQAMYLHTRLTEFLLIPLNDLSYLEHRRLSSVMNVLGGECLCLREISININKLFTLVLAELLLSVYLFIFFVLLHCCYWLFTSLSLFFADVVAAFLFIR